VVTSSWGLWLGSTTLKYITPYQRLLLVLRRLKPITTTHNYNTRNSKCPLSPAVSRCLQPDFKFHVVTRSYTSLHVVTRRYTSSHVVTRRYTSLHVVTRRFTSFHVELPNHHPQHIASFVQRSCPRTDIGAEALYQILHAEPSVAGHWTIAVYIPGG